MIFRHRVCSLVPMSRDALRSCDVDESIIADAMGFLRDRANRCQLLFRMYKAFVAPGSYSAGFIVLPEAVGRSQGQTSVLVQFLAAGPTHRMPLALHLDLGLQPKPFPLRSLWQCELCLPNFPGRGYPASRHPAAFT